MRVFYAVTFKEKTKKDLKKIKDIIENNSKKGRFSYYKNYHITLEFIGEVNIDKLVLLKDILKEFKEIPDVLNFDKIGNFSRRDGDIVWLGIEENTNLIELNKKLKILLESRGFEIDKRKFTPHLTIGRKVLMESSYESIHIHSIKAEVNSIALMESKRVKEKLVYEVIEEIKI